MDKMLCLYKIRIGFALVLASGLLSLSLPALAENCDFLSITKTDLSYQRFPAKKEDPCMLIAHPREGSNGESIVFNQQGQMMFFLNYSQTGVASKDTGSHTYFIVPTESNLDIPDRTTDGDNIVQTASGIKIEMGKTKKGGLEIKNMQGCEKKNKAMGWAIKGNLNARCTGRLIIDAKEAKGGQAAQNPNGKSFILGADGSSCEVENKDIYNYKISKIKGANTFSLKIQTIEQIREFAKKHPACSDTISSLTVKSTSTTIRYPDEDESTPPGPAAK